MNDDRNYQIIARAFRESGGIHLLISNKSFDRLDRLSDLIIELGFINYGTNTQRYMEVIKAINQEHYMGKKDLKFLIKKG